MNTTIYNHQPSERGTWLVVCIAFAIAWLCLAPFTFGISLIGTIGSLLAYTLPVGHAQPLLPLPAGWDPNYRNLPPFKKN